MGAASGAEPVRAGQKVLLVNRLQQHHHRALKNLVLQRGDADRPRLLTRPALGNMHPTHRRRAVRAGLRAVEQMLEVRFQITLVRLRRHAVHAHRAVLARAPIRLFQPIEVHQIGQRSERHLRRLFRQCCYPFLFRGHGVRISMHSSCVSKTGPWFGVSLPSNGSPAGRDSPPSSVLSRRYDFLSPVPPHFVAFARRYHVSHRCSLRSAPECAGRRPRAFRFHSAARHRRSHVETTGPPKFLGNPHCPSAHALRLRQTDASRPLTDASRGPC